jgi:hypothetical protein
MKTFEEKIEEALRENSEWSGSADALWGKISSQIKSRPLRDSFRRRSLWAGAAAAATFFLAFMLHTMLGPPPLPPEVPEGMELARMQTFSAIMLAEPEVYYPGDQVELTLSTYPSSDWDEGHDLRLIIWKTMEAEQILAGEVSLLDEQMKGQESVWVQSPMEPGLYRFVVEGTFVDGDQRLSVFAEKTILVEGERSDEKLEND